MLAQVLDRVQESPGRRHFDRVAGVRTRVCATNSRPIHVARRREKGIALRGDIVEEGEERICVICRDAKLRITIAVRQRFAERRAKPGARAVQ